uniref:Uncharacterized protein n=1 Tax=Anguilla anguilla TaxID=7936 RepID=A0A0E9PSW1_ANGAN
MTKNVMFFVSHTVHQADQHHLHSPL